MGDSCMFHLIVGAAIVFFVGRAAIRYYRARLYQKRLAIWVQSSLNVSLEPGALHARHPDDPRGWGWDTTEEMLGHSSRNE